MKFIPRHLFDAASKPLARRYRRSPSAIGPTGVSVEICQEVTSGKAVAIAIENGRAARFADAIDRVLSGTGDAFDLVCRLRDRLRGGAR